jgi:hypothetical protein
VHYFETNDSALSIPKDYILLYFSFTISPSSASHAWLGVPSAYSNKDFGPKFISRSPTPQCCTHVFLLILIPTPLFSAFHPHTLILARPPLSSPLSTSPTAVAASSMAEAARWPRWRRSSRRRLRSGRTATRRHTWRRRRLGRRRQPRRLPRRPPQIWSGARGGGGGGRRRRHRRAVVVAADAASSLPAVAHAIPASPTLPLPGAPPTPTSSGGDILGTWRRSGGGCADLERPRRPQRRRRRRGSEDVAAVARPRPALLTDGGGGVSSPHPLHRRRWRGLELASESRVLVLASLISGPRALLFKRGSRSFAGNRRSY